MLNHSCLGTAIVIPPLQTIQVQLADLCKSWKIPYLNLAEVKNPGEISKKLEGFNPKIIITSIEDISNEEIQAQLQTIDVQYVAMDECQVTEYFIMMKIFR